ncbi:TPA: molecular chaperone [Photobacterium damselae subsp. damselae]
MSKTYINNMIFMSILLFVNAANSAVSLDRTRIIYNGDNKSMTVNISNDNKSLPYLAQAWLEDSQGKKLIMGPLIATPPVQRLEPDSKSMVRLSLSDSNLPKDHESLFYFNLREIPPKSKKANVLQIALQTKVKVFYRPESIKSKPNEIWQDQIIFEENKNGYNLINPTPYFVTITAIFGNEKELSKTDFKPIMLSPKSETNVKSRHYKRPMFSYINDYGGRPIIEMNCKNRVCHADKNK